MIFLLLQVRGLLQVVDNGSLIFHAFPAHLYDSTVHNSVYMCRVQSDAGIIISRPCSVSAGKILKLKMFYFEFYQMTITNDHVIMSGMVQLNFSYFSLELNTCSTNIKPPFGHYSKFENKFFLSMKNE